ncbi:DUF1120 domain-containing protein [Serratia sp. IR-2025]|nr:hypothetical protein SME23J_36990 [Serratia marcescens]
MKKNALRMTVLSSLFLSAASLAAGPSAEIKVTGELTAPTCDVTLPQGGVFDFGSISHTLVSATQPTSLGHAGGSYMTVNCSMETPLTFRVVDNRLGTASISGSKYLGLGNVNGSGKLGYYTLNAKMPQIDGRLGSMFGTTNGTIGSLSSDIPLEHGKRFGWAPSGQQKLAIGKKFEVMMVAEAFLAKKADMQGGIGDDVKLDGSTTLEFGFGL